MASEPATIRVQQGTYEEIAGGARNRPPDQAITAIFRNPADGTDLPVTISVFQYGADPRLFGVGAYLADENSELARGTVLRWDDGPEAAPAIIHWQAPHCAADECGAPCGHQEDS